MMRLKNKTAFIAGAGRNNGRAIAIAFAREGADLVLVSKSRGDDLNQVAMECESLGAKVLPLLADVSKPAEVNRIVGEGLERFGKIDVLANVAGKRMQKLPWEFSYEEWHEIFEINLHSTFYLAKAIVPGMLENRSGSIIALGGHSALTAASPYVAALAASKHGLYGLIKALAQALGPYNVRANLLALAHIENERRNPEWYAGAGAETEDSSKIAKTPLRRLGTGEEVAKTALFLASDESSFITGDRICCNGGSYM